MVKIIENYSLHEQIGEGEYGKVYRGVDSRNKKEVAVKVINVKKFKEYPKLQECTLNEIQVLSNIESPHIVKFIEILKTANNFYFFYEYCNQGTLEDVIKSKGCLTEHQALNYLSQILDAFKILSSKHIMHRDLKPSNILMKDGVIKLADFGFCKSLESHRDLAQTMLGSPIYMAPEVLKGQIYTIKADIWSLGVVFYEMLFGFCPFEERSIARLINLLDTQEVQFKKQINNISPAVEQFVRKMLVKDHFKRISWNQILEYKINGCSILPAPTSLRERKNSEQPRQYRTVSQTSVAPRNQLQQIINFENRPYSRPSFEVLQNQFSTKKGCDVNMPGMFKKKQNIQNKQNSENVSPSVSSSQKASLIREKVKKQLKMCHEIINYNFCPEVTAQLCLKIYHLAQKQHCRLEDALKPLPSWYFQQKNKLNQIINIFQEEASKSDKNVNGPLLTYYIKTLQTHHRDHFVTNSANKQILIHSLNLLDLNEQSSNYNEKKMEYPKGGIDYNLVVKDKLITELYQKIIRNVI